jgi:GT2 family glycosyltransferase
MDLSIIIVSYNTKDYLGRCLRSVYDNRFDGKFEILVVDNASSDGTPEMIEADFPDITLIPNDKNVGFSMAVNQALGIAEGDWILLLNPDTLILPSALDNLAKFMEEHGDAGAASPRQWLDPEKNFLTTITAKPPSLAILASKIPLIRRFARKALHNRIWKEDFEIWKAIVPLEVSTLNGACLFVRRRMIEDVGLLDEHFFLFFEDVDWSRRMRDKGWALYLVPDAEIVHLGMRSVQIAQNIQKIIDKSRDYYIRKHIGLGGRFLWRLYSLYKTFFSEGSQRIIREETPSSSPPKREPPLTKDIEPSPIERGLSSTGMAADASVSLRWNPIEGVAGYVVELSQDPLFLYKGGAIVEESCLSLGPSLRELWSTGTYFWRVAPVYRNGTLGEYSRSKIFCL